MPDNRDDYEPIIATRPRRDPVREDTQPLWRLVLALGGGLAVVVFVAWWFMGRASNEVASTSVPAPAPTAEVVPDEVAIEQPPAPPPRSAEPEATSEPAATPESVPAVVPEAVPDTPAPTPSTPAVASVRLTSPDAQVQFEVRALDSSAPLTKKVGDVVELAPGTYRIVASGAQLETLEREIVLEGLPAEFSVELCAQPQQELETLTGQVVEERACATTAQCESMFTVLSEHAEQLVNDRAFRTQQCAKWRAEAAPQGRWTLDTKCDGATLATTCRIEIAQGACAVSEPRRSVRGGACPQAELK